MTRYLTIAALVGVIGLLSLLWVQSGRLSAARNDARRWQAEAKTFEYMLDRAEQAAAVHRAHLDRMATEAVRTAEMLQYLEAPEDDRPLSPLLRRTLDRLRAR